MTLSANDQTNREATATIRGYIYQFDASILALLSCKPDEVVTIEGVEDFDIFSDEADVHAQVKYYEAQKLTDSTLRDAILPMIEGYLGNLPSARSRKKYVLYGHFKDAPQAVPKHSLEDMQRILIQRRIHIDGETGKRSSTQENLQAKLKISDAELADFSARLSVNLSESFDEHRLRVIAKLKEVFNVYLIEAEKFHYPSALALVAELASARSKRGRTISRHEFLRAIRPSVAIYSAWALRNEGESAYCRTIRALHFSQLNIESYDRFFVVTLPVQDGDDDLYSLVQHIIGRWSSHKSTRKPDNERYAPFFFFPAVSPGALAALKTRLFKEGHKITDGFPFNGATFSPDHLRLAQTTDNPISARFVSTMEQLDLALSTSTRSTLVIQLHSGEPQKISRQIQEIVVPITGAAMAKKIV